MQTNTPSANGQRAPAKALFDYSPADDCFSDAGLAAIKLNADDQLTRFLQWLQFTDRGHQPC